MIVSENIRFHIDYASEFRVSGWIIDMLIKCQPAHLAFKLPNGTLFEFPFSSGQISRPDVCEQFMLPSSTAVGFDINLRDLFNDCCPDYSLIANNVEIWSRELSLAELDAISHAYNGELVQEFGNHQIIICYEKNSWFHRLIQSIYIWNPLYFSRDYQGKVSFLFIEISDLKEFKEKIIKNSDRSLLVMERAVWPKLMHISPTIGGGMPTIVLDQQIQFELDFSGMLCVACDRARISNKTELLPSNLLAFLGVLSGHADLFFDSETSLYVHQSGVVDSQVKTYVQELVQERMVWGVLVVSRKPLLRLSDVSIESCSVFVRISELRFLLDALAQPPDIFLQTAYRRGRRVNTVVVR